MRRLYLGLLSVCLWLVAVWSVNALSGGGADLVVHLPTSQVIQRHVALEAPITGLELLQRSGLRVETAGGAVCRIENVGCPATDCFCDFKPGGTQHFWAYWRWTGSGWESSNVGAGQATVTPGALDGWRWGDGPPTMTNGRSPSLIEPQRAAYAAVDWLRTQQQADGGFTDADNIGLTLDAILGATSADADIAAWRSPTGQTTLDFLTAHAPSYSGESTAALGKMVAGVVAAEGNPYSVGGRDLVAQTRAALRNGRFGQSNWDQAWAMLGLTAAGEAVPSEAVQTLLGDAGANGGWGYAPRANGESDSTALVLQALVAANAPVTHTAISNAKVFLHGVQNEDGGFGVRAGDESNVPSTALTVASLVAIGENPLSPAWRKGGHSPLDYLMAQQSPPGGFAGVLGPNDVQATGQTLPALMGKPLPVRGKRVAALRATAWLRTQQADDGHFGFGMGNTIDALFVIGALNENPDTWRRPGGPSVLDYLRPNALSYAQSSPAANAKLVLGLLAVGQDPRSFGGVDLVRLLTDRAPFDHTNLDRAWAVLILRALGLSSEVGVNELRANQAANGGWAFDASSAPDTNTTALAVQALVAAGEPITSTTIMSATAYLRTQQDPVGGFRYPFEGQTEPDVNSTGLVLQALTALHADPDGLGWTTRLTATNAITLTAHTPVDWLLAQQSARGAFQFGGEDSVYATLQAAPALLDRPLPIITYRVNLPLLERGYRLRSVPTP